MVILQEKQIEVRNPVMIASVLREWLAALDSVDRAKEHFFVVLLDVRSNVKLIDVVSVGTLNASLVHPREVFVRAITNQSAQLIIAHNHPSGCCAPSDADVDITKRLRQAGSIIGIELVDHIVISLDDYYSFLEHNIL